MKQENEVKDFSYVKPKLKEEGGKAGKGKKKAATTKGQNAIKKNKKPAGGKKGAKKGKKGSDEEEEIDSDDSLNDFIASNDELEYEKPKNKGKTGKKGGRN